MRLREGPACGRSRRVVARVVEGKARELRRAVVVAGIRGATARIVLVISRAGREPSFEQARALLQDRGVVTIDM